jgi:hypothetical protein
VKRGRLIAFEGLDGCGKGTQIARLREHLGDVEAVFTREPTDGPHGRQIRAAARKGDPVAPEQELAWFTQDRREHVDSVIEPALAAGKLVITDRYYLSTVAYQGARGLDWQEILRDSEAAYPMPGAPPATRSSSARTFSRERPRSLPPSNAPTSRVSTARVARSRWRARCRPQSMPSWKPDPGGSPGSRAAAAR